MECGVCENRNSRRKTKELVQVETRHGVSLLPIILIGYDVFMKWRVFGIKRIIFPDAPFSHTV